MSRGWSAPIEPFSSSSSISKEAIQGLPPSGRGFELNEGVLQGVKAKAGDPPSPSVGRDIVAEARAAAAAGDEEEGVEGAAAKAAARAACLGVAAACTAYSSLGGVEEHVGPAPSCLLASSCNLPLNAWFRCLPATWSCLFML